MISAFEANNAFLKSNKERISELEAEIYTEIAKVAPSSTHTSFILTDEELSIANELARRLKLQGFLTRVGSIVEGTRLFVDWVDPGDHA